MRQVTEIYINTDTQDRQARDLISNPTRYILSPSKIELRLHLQDVEGNYKSYGVGDWYLGIAQDYLPNTPILTEAFNRDFNAGTWSSESFTGGKVSVQLDTATAAMATALTSVATLPAYLVIWHKPTGQGSYMVCHMPITLRKIPVVIP
jgi:hypothetical protein